LADYDWLDRRYNELLIVTFCGIFFFIGLYHVLLFLNHRKESYNFYYGVFSIVAGIYFFVRTTTVYHFIPDTNILNRIETASLYLIIPFASAFLEHLIQRKIFLSLKIYGAFCIFLAIIQSVFSMSFRHDVLRIWQISAILGLLYVLIFDLFLQFALVVRERKSLRHASGGDPSLIEIILEVLIKLPLGNIVIFALILSLCMLIDIVNELVFFLDFTMSNYAFFFFSLSIAFMLSQRYGNLFKEVSDTNEKLESYNKSILRFVPLQFMNELGVSDITKLSLGASVQREYSVLFFDIRSFSIHSEMMSTRENFIFINRVLGITGPILRKYNGFVDKYLGDSAMALFQDAWDAVQAGIDIYDKLILDEKTRVTIGGDRINIGIGVHSGKVMLGIVGENERLSSTVISKNVNLASRMESLTKQTGSGMLITRETMNLIDTRRDNFESRFIGQIQVAGTNEVVGAFDILDALPEGMRKKRIGTKAIFESGIRCYHTKEYQKACAKFNEVLKFDTEDMCARVYAREAERRMRDPRLPGVFIYDKK
jgi:class 3 adenylate cyclase